MKLKERIKLYEKNKQAKIKVLEVRDWSSLYRMLQHKITEIVIYANGTEVRNSNLELALRDLATLLGYKIKGRK